MGKRSELSTGALEARRVDGEAREALRRLGANAGAWRDNFLAGGQAALEGKAGGKADPARLARLVVRRAR